jgi:hypothetical protein
MKKRNYIAVILFLAAATLMAVGGMDLHNPSSVSAGGGSSYLVYTALLTQSGTDAPIATVLTNTLGETPTLEYIDVGYYSLSVVANRFTANKTAVFISQPAFDFSGPASRLTSANIDGDNPLTIVRIRAMQINGSNNITQTPSDDILSLVFIEIRVYP